MSTWRGATVPVMDGLRRAAGDIADEVRQQKHVYCTPNQKCRAGLRDVRKAAASLGRQWLDLGKGDTGVVVNVDGLGAPGNAVSDPSKNATAL